MKATHTAFVLSLSILAGCSDHETGDSRYGLAAAPLQTEETSLIETACTSDAGTFPEPPPWNGGADQVLFVEAGAYPVSLAVDNNAAFWSDTAANLTMKVSLEDGGVGALATGLSGNIVTDGTNVYLAGPHDVWRVAVGGGAPVRLAPGIVLKSITVNAGDLFGVGSGEDGGTGLCALKVSAASGSVAILYCGSFSQSFWPVTVDGTTVFFVDGQSIMSIPVAGGTAKTLATGEDVWDLTAHGRLFWTLANTGSGATVRTTAETGGCPKTLFSVPGSGGPIAVDSTDVYFTSNASGQLFAVPRDGGAAGYVPQTQNAPPFAVQVHGNRLFWTQLPLFGLPLGQVTMALKP